MKPQRYYPFIQYLPLALAAPLFWVLSTSNFVSHSELWSISSGKLLGATSSEALIVYIRPFFYALLKIPFYLNLDNQQHIYFARALFGVLGFLISFLSWLLVKKITRETWIASTYLIFLLSFHVFTYNIFRVRSDILCQVMVLGTLIVTFNYIEENKTHFNWYLPLLALLISITTPKSFYSIVWLCLFYTFFSWQKRKPFQIIKDNLFYFLAPSYLLILAVFIVEIFFDRANNIFAIALNYYVESFIYNWNWEALNAIFRSLSINFLNYVFILLGLGLAFFKKTKGKQDKALLLLFFLALITLAFHPERWDYFIASLIPYLSLPMIFVVQKIKTKKTLAILLVALIVTPLHMTYYKPWWKSNQLQMEKVRELEVLMHSNPTAQYFDSTGILPREHSLLWFMGPGDSMSNQNTLKSLSIEKPEIIFKTTKLRHGGSDLLIFLHKYYEEKRPDIWIRKDFLPKFNAQALENIRTPIEGIFIYDHHPKVRSFH